MKEHCKTIVDQMAILAKVGHVLTGAEWIDNYGDVKGQHCIFCSGTPFMGHSGYCKIKKVIADIDAIGGVEK